MGALLSWGDDSIKRGACGGGRGQGRLSGHTGGVFLYGLTPAYLSDFSARKNDNTDFYKPVMGIWTDFQNDGKWALGG
jgi:hypothetical protein